MPPMGSPEVRNRKSDHSIYHNHALQSMRVYYQKYEFFPLPKGIVFGIRRFLLTNLSEYDI